MSTCKKTGDVLAVEVEMQRLKAAIDRMAKAAAESDDFWSHRGRYKNQAAVRRAALDLWHALPLLQSGELMEKTK